MGIDKALCLGKTILINLLVFALFEIYSTIAYFEKTVEKVTWDNHYW